MSAASLPVSAAAKSLAGSSRTSAPMAVARAPSTGLPLAFILAGLISLFAGIGWFLARPTILSTYHYNQFVIFATHMFVLGWSCSVVMGAMYQLVPVALEPKLYSERLGKIQFAVHVGGF